MYIRRSFFVSLFAVAFLAACGGSSTEPLTHAANTTPDVTHSPEASPAPAPTSTGNTVVLHDAGGTPTQVQDSGVDAGDQPDSGAVLPGDDAAIQADGATSQQDSGQVEPPDVGAPDATADADVSQDSAATDVETPDASDGLYAPCHQGSTTECNAYAPYCMSVSLSQFFCTRNCVTNADCSSGFCHTSINMCSLTN